MSDAYDDCECDFPGCKKDFDFGSAMSGKMIAILGGDNEVRAFCEEHASLLKSWGVKLESMARVHKKQSRQKKV